MSLRSFCISPEDTKRLIKEVKARECLWNSESENYNDRYSVMTAWRDIAKIMDAPEDILKLKWKSLRDLFNREKKKHKFSTIEEYPGRWKYLELMWFMYKPDEVTQEDNDNDRYERYEFENGIDNDVQSFSEATIKFEPLEDRRDHEVFLKEDCMPKIQNCSEKDYDMMFLQSLTPFFSQLDPVRKLVVRSKIHDILLNEISAQSSNKYKK